MLFFWRWTIPFKGHVYIVMVSSGKSVSQFEPRFVLWMFPNISFYFSLLCRYSLVCEPCINKCIFYYDILLYVTVFGREDFRSSLGYSPSVSKAQQYRMRQCFVFLSSEDSTCLSKRAVLSSFLIVCVRNGLKTRQNLPMHNMKEA